MKFIQKFVLDIFEMEIAVQAKEQSIHIKMIYFGPNKLIAIKGLTLEAGQRFLTEIQLQDLQTLTEIIICTKADLGTEERNIG